MRLELLMNVTLVRTEGGMPVTNEIVLCGSGRTGGNRLRLSGIRDGDFTRVLGAHFGKNDAVRVTIEAPVEKTEAIDRCRAELSAACEKAAGDVQRVVDEYPDGPSEAVWESIVQAFAAYRKAKAALTEAEIGDGPCTSAATANVLLASLTDRVYEAALDVVKAVEQLACDAEIKTVHGKQMVFVPADAWNDLTKWIDKHDEAASTLAAARKAYNADG